MKDKPCTIFKAQLAALLLLSLLLLFPGTRQPALYLLPPLSLSLLAAALLLERRYKAEKARQEAREEALLKESALFQRLRHDLSNHLQVITCLSQLGRGERVLQALFSLNEKLKAFGEFKKGCSADLAADLGALIFSLPAEASLTYAWELSPAGEVNDPLSPEIPGQVVTLTAALASRRPTGVSLVVTGGGEACWLDVRADLAGADEEALKLCFEAEASLLKGFGELGEAAHLRCRIPLNRAIS